VKATKVNAGLAESNGRLLLGIWCDSLHVTCGLTAHTPGSSPRPTLGNEYGKTLPFLPYCSILFLLCHPSAVGNWAVLWAHLMHLSCTSVARVEPRPSAVNMALPAFAAERRAAVPLLLNAGACYRSISPVCRVLSSKPTTHRCCCWLMGQTDGCTLDYFIDPTPQTMWAVSIMQTVGL